MNVLGGQNVWTMVLSSSRVILAVPLILNLKPQCIRTISNAFGVLSMFQACAVWLSFYISNPSLCTISLEMKHPVVSLFINALASPMILPSCFQIEIGRQIELDLNPKINIGAIMKKEGSIGLSTPFKKMYDDQEVKHGV